MINQAIQEAEKMIEERELLQCDHFSKWISIELDALNELIERLEALPQEQSLEELLKEMPYWTQLIYMTTYFMAQTVYHSAHWKTPREALLALRDKLSKQ